MYTSVCVSRFIYVCIMCVLCACLFECTVILCTVIIDYVAIIRPFLQLRVSVSVYLLSSLGL